MMVVFLSMASSRKFEDLGDTVLPENLAYCAQIFGTL
jgi:uncharacterized protein involved in tolerance to divalent cations